MKAKEKSAARSPRVGMDTPVKVRRGLLLMSPSKLVQSGGISFDRLEQIEAEIGRGTPIDGPLRFEVRQLIAYVLSLQDAKRGRGAPRGSWLTTLAKITGALNELHGIPVAQAARALVRDPDSEEGFNRAKAIQRAWVSLKKKGGKNTINASLVKDALALIRERKGT